MQLKLWCCGDLRVRGGNEGRDVLQTRAHSPQIFATIKDKFNILQHHLNLNK